jgi:hypothetical protein
MTLELSVGLERTKSRDDVGEFCRLVVGWRISKTARTWFFLNLKNIFRAIIPWPPSQALLSTNKMGMSATLKQEFTINPMVKGQAHRKTALFIRIRSLHRCTSKD